MSKDKKPSKKQIKKLVCKECYFCGCDEYALLDVHRIIPGKDGGKYSNDYNLIVLCSLCHRKVHADIIKILGKHFSTTGQFIIHYLDENGIEQWK